MVDIILKNLGSNAAVWHPIDLILQKQPNESRKILEILQKQLSLFRWIAISGRHRGKKQTWKVFDLFLLD
jgi:hypothetical protein